MAFVDSLSDREIDSLLTKFDATAAPLKRRIVAELTVKASMAEELLEACRLLLMCSLPRDVSGQAMVDNRDGTILISHGWVQWHPKHDENGLLYYATIEGRTAWWHCEKHAMENRIYWS
jgi:hypothetical protein